MLLSIVNINWRDFVKNRLSKIWGGYIRTYTKITPRLEKVSDFNSRSVILVEEYPYSIQV